MSSLEIRVAKIADGVGQIPEGEDYARDLYIIIGDMASDLIERRQAAYDQYKGAFLKWLDFHNATIDAERSTADIATERERARIMRLIVASPHWHGGYQALLKLLSTQD